MGRSLTVNQKSKILWLLFFLNLLVMPIVTFYYFLKPALFYNSYIKLLASSPTILLIYLHAKWSFPRNRGLVFLALSAFVGFMAEFAGTRSGAIFGGFYKYRPETLMIFNIPVLVIFLWPVFIYIGYCVVTSFLFWTGRDKPSIINKRILLLPFLILADGLITVSIDLIMDPLQVVSGYYGWSVPGRFFSVPIGNFLGWILVTAVVTTIWRLFEYFFPENAEAETRSFFIIPPLSYGVLAVTLVITAFYMGLPIVGLIGLFCVFPIIMANLLLFTRERKVKGIWQI